MDEFRQPHTKRLLEQWKSTRSMKPGNNNWLLFSAMVECGLKEFGGEWDFTIVKKQSFLMRMVQR